MGYPPVHRPLPVFPESLLHERTTIRFLEDGCREGFPDDWWKPPCLGRPRLSRSFEQEKKWLPVLRDRTWNDHLQLWIRGENKLIMMVMAALSSQTTSHITRRALGLFAWTVKSVWRVNPKKGGVWQLMLRAQIKKCPKRKLVQVANLPTCRDGTLITKGPVYGSKNTPCSLLYKVESNGLGATVPSIVTVRTCCSNSPSGKFRQENKSEDQRTKCLQCFFKRRPQRLEVPGHGLVWSIMFSIVEIT